jgi:hypothetical protein
MSEWQDEAEGVIRQAWSVATERSDARLRMAACRAVEAMVKDGFTMPANLLTYARQTRLLYGYLDRIPVRSDAPAMAG